MTDAVAIALTIAIPNTLIALATLINSIRNGARLKTVEKSVNGLGEKRNIATQKSAFAEGVKDEKERHELKP